VGDLQLSHFPIVISDWSMPEIDGPELCRRMRARATDKYSYSSCQATGGRNATSKAWRRAPTISSPNDRHDEAAGAAQSRGAILGLVSMSSSIRGLLPIVRTANAIATPRKVERSKRYVEERSGRQFSPRLLSRLLRKDVRPQLEEP